jgi:hypothetical protein
VIGWAPARSPTTTGRLVPWTGGEQAISVHAEEYRARVLSVFDETLLTN